jgi:hypothetical protein
MRRETTMWQLLVRRIRQQVLALVALGLALLSLKRSASIVPGYVSIEATAFAINHDATVVASVKDVDGLDETSHIDITPHHQQQSNTSFRFPFREGYEYPDANASLAGKPLGSTRTRQPQPQQQQRRRHQNHTNAIPRTIIFTHYSNLLDETLQTRTRSRTKNLELRALVENVHATVALHPDATTRF